MRLVAPCLAALLLTLAGCATPPTHPSLQHGSATAAPTLPPLLPVRSFVADLDSSGAYQISPDGRQLLWQARRGLEPGLFVKDLQTGVTHSHAVRGFGLWARDSRHVLLHMDAGGDENTHVFELDGRADTLDLRDLTPFAGARSFLHAQLDDSPDLLIESNRRDPKVYDLYRLVRNTGELRLLARNPGDVALWLTDRRGQVLGRAARRQAQWVFETPPELPSETAAPAATAAALPDAVTALPEGGWRERFRVDFFQTVQPLMLSADGTFLWALSNRGRDTLALVKLDLPSGQEQVVHADARVDVSQVVFSRRRREPLALALDPDVQQWQFLDPAFERVARRLLGTAPARLAVQGMSDDDDTLVATVVHGDGGEHLLYRRGDDSVTTLAELTSRRLHALSPLGVAQPVRFRSRDGLDLHGYLTLPPGRMTDQPPGRPLPTVLYVHGGPWARDLHLSGDPMPAFLANRGYAVLQLNYRGSTGYGRAFRDAAQGEFAGRMHTDLIDALDTLIGQGITDPTRIAIMGASYGGYASLVGMTFTPERFACGISVVGMSDLASLIEQAPPYWELGKPMWLRFVGDPADPLARPGIDARSPLYRADQVRGPLLLLHGANDPRVKLDQSLRMAQALRAAGKPVELHVFGKAGHGFHRWQDKLRYFRLTEDFLAGCLGGRSGGFDMFEIGAWLF